MSFQDWSQFVLNIEKRYANDPDDSGGETWYGFTEAFIKSIDEPAPKTPEQATDLLWDYFWAEHALYDMDWLVAWCYGDALFHHSPRSATKCLQAGLDVAQDGWIGPITMKAAKNVRRIQFWEKYSIRRNRLFHAIARHRKKDQKFVEGWNNRLIKLTAAAYRANSIV